MESGAIRRHGRCCTSCVEPWFVPVVSEAETELRSGIESLKPEEAAVLALLRSRLEKEVEGSHTCGCGCGGTAPGSEC